MHRLWSALLVCVFMLSTAHADGGLVRVKSAYSVQQTLDRLESAVSEKGMTVFARIDHAAGAAKVNKQLRPTELLIFGNPRVGTLLMQSNQQTGLDLPLKALAYQDGRGDVWLVYNDPGYLASRHRIEDKGQVIENMQKAMKMFSSAATGQ